MLLDPLEEQLDLPSGLVQLADGPCRQRQVVGEENKVFLAEGVAINDPPQLFRVKLRGQGTSQGDGLIATQTGALVDRMRVDPAELQLVSGPNDIEGEGVSPPSQGFLETLSCRSL